jgi:hypothetical protein
MTESTVEQLRAFKAAGKVPASDARFVDSLLNKAERNQLTLPMREWINKLVEQYNAPPLRHKLPGLRNLVALFDRAQQSAVKSPKIWLRFPDETRLRISTCGQKSKTPGFLQLTDGESFQKSRFFGRINPGGKLEIVRNGFAVQNELVELLTAFSNSPERVASDFGRETGHCCFCSLPVTEQSEKVGYHLSCGETFGISPPAPSKKRKAVRS